MSRIAASRGRLGLAALLLLLAGCSAIKLTYNNADVLARYRVSDYVQFTPPQAEQFKARFALLHQWHRAQELPAYAKLLQAASQRMGRGLTQEDVAWALANSRSQYHKLVARAAADAAPLLVTFSAEQLQQVERRFAQNNRKYAEDRLEGNTRRLHYQRTVQLEDYFKEWVGALTDAQADRIERFADEYGQMQALRLEDRKRAQQTTLALLRSERDPARLGQRLAVLLGDPDQQRPAEYRNASAQFEAHLATLIVDVDRLLSPQQRSRAQQRMLGYAEDFATLSATTATSALELLAGF